MPVHAAYRKLLSSFGPQGWWPLIRGPRGAAPKTSEAALPRVIPRSASFPCYHPGVYRKPGPGQALEICLGTILTQNTAWSNVVKALGALSGAGALDAERILRMSPARLQTLIRPSGYFVQKAVKLKEFCRRARQNGGAGRWLSAPLGPLREELLRVHGVGPETADSMLLYAGFRPAFVVDAYTRRITQRLGWLEEGADYARTRAYLAARLPRSVKVYQEFHALFVELAKRFCSKRDPECPRCPLRGNCRTGRKHG
ncbi:MAG: hypothetical protein AAB576_08785 [Elusimicrobiota bacterium]|mgnify:CR=1 FL=1